MNNFYSLVALVTAGFLFALHHTWVEIILYALFWPFYWGIRLAQHLGAA